LDSADHSPPPPSDDLTKRLYERFVPEVEKLEEVLRRNLQDWKWARRPASTRATTDTLDCGASTPDPDAANRAIA